MIKRLLVMVMCCVMLITMSACEKTDNENTTESVENTEITDSEPEMIETDADEDETTADVTEESNSEETDSERTGFDVTAEDLYHANKMSNLLSIYGSVKCDMPFIDGTLTKCYFIKDGSEVFLYKTIYEDGYTEYTGWYKGTDFTIMQNWSYVSLYIGDTDYSFDYVCNNEISDYFINVSVKLIEEGPDYYVVAIDDEEMVGYASTKQFLVDKDTLAVKSIVEVDEGEVYETEYIYGEEIEDTHILDVWDGELKKVTVISEIYDMDEYINKTYEYEIPLDWHVEVYSSEEIMKYLDSDYTIPYEYPGDGVDYTIYVTNSLG